MIKLKHLIVSASLIAMPMQVMAATQVNMAPIISYLLSDSKPVLSDDEKWVEGKVMNYFWLDEDDGEPEVGYATVTLNGSGIDILEYDLNISDGSWNLGYHDDEKLNQTTGAWEVPSVYTYVIDHDDENILTVNGAKSIRIDKVTNLEGMTVTFGETHIAIPVSFSAGALKYDLSEKVLVDTYELEWTPTVWNQNGNTGVTFSSLIDYVSSQGNFYHDSENQKGVNTKKNQNYNKALDTLGAEITTLALGTTGILVENCYDGSCQETEVGTWTVINLPGQDNPSILSIRADLNASTMTTDQYNTYMDDGKSFATTYNGTVNMVEFQTAMTNFVSDDEDVAGNEIAMSDIKSAVENHDFSTINVQGYFESGIKFFGNENGLRGYRTLDKANGTYTGSVDGTQTGVIDIAGTYSVTNNVITFNRTSPSVLKLEFTHVAPTNSGSGQHFSIVKNDATNSVFNSYSYDNEQARNEYAPFSTKAYFESRTRYFFNKNRLKGERNLDGMGGYNVILNKDTDISLHGSYSVLNNIITFSRDNGDTVILTYMNSIGSGELFTSTFNTNTPSITINFDSAMQRDDYTLFSADIGFDAAISMTNVTPAVGSVWYEMDMEDNGNLYSEGELNVTSATQFSYKEGNSTDTLYYRSVSDTEYGDVLGLSKTSSGTIDEYVKFSAVMDKSELEIRYPFANWPDGSEAILHAGATIGESFDAWDGDYGTVGAYSIFTTLISNMKADFVSNDDNFIIGNGQDLLLFHANTANDATSGTIIASYGNDNAGTFEIRDVDGVSTMVITITDPYFDDDHIAFQYNNGAMRRGEIYDRWSSIMLNAAAKDYILEQMSSSELIGSWVLDETPLADGGRNVITFLDDNNYIVIHESANSDQGLGTAERGTYVWDGTNITFTYVSDTDGEGGFTSSSSSTNTIGLTVNSNQATFDDGEGNFIFDKVTSISETLIGAWVLVDGGIPHVLTIFEGDGGYCIVHADSLNGEFGTATENGTYMTFSQSVNTDGDGGLSGIVGNITVTETPNISLNFNASTEDFTFLRLK